jgi:hypothetical protein
LELDINALEGVASNGTSLEMIVQYPLPYAISDQLVLIGNVRVDHVEPLVLRAAVEKLLGIAINVWSPDAIAAHDTPNPSVGSVVDVCRNPGAENVTLGST